MRDALSVIPLKAARPFRLLAFAAKLFFPFVELIASDAQLKCELRSRLLVKLKQTNGLELELPAVTNAPSHQTPPRGYYPLLGVSENSGLAQGAPCDLRHARTNRSNVRRRQAVDVHRAPTICSIIFGFLRSEY